MKTRPKGMKTLKIMKKLIAGLSCAAIVFSLTACNDTTWSYQIDDTTITSGMYIAFQISAYMEARNEVKDPSVDVLEQKIGEKDAEAWINEKVLEYSKAYVAVEKKFDELGLTLTDSDKNKLENQLENMWYYYQSSYEPNGAGQKSLKKILWNNYKQNLIFKKYYDTNGTEAVSEAALKKEFEENYALVKYVQLPMKDAAGNKLKTEGKEALKKTAEQYLARLNKGEDIDKLIAEYDEILEKQEEALKNTSSNASGSTSSGKTSSTATSSAAAFSVAASSAATTSVATASTATSSVATASGTTSSGATASGATQEVDKHANEKIIYKKDENLAEKFLTGIFNAKLGTPVIVEDDENYYVTIRYNLMEDKEHLEEYHDELLTNLKGDEFEAKIKTWYQDYKVVINEHSAKRYRVKKLSF